MLDKIYDSRLRALGREYVNMYRAGIFQLEMLLTLPTVRKATLCIYSVLICRREIIPIENLPDEQKEQLKDLCRPFVEGIGPEIGKEFAKCYWALDQLANEEKNKS